MIGGLEINEETVEVTVDGKPVKLTPIEYKILLLLAKIPEEYFRRKKFMKESGRKGSGNGYGYGPCQKYPRKIELDPKIRNIKGGVGSWIQN